MTKKIKEIDITEEQLNSSITHILNWYHQEKSKTDAKNFLIEYCEKYANEYVSIVRNMGETSIVPTYGWIARFVLRGFEFDDYHEKIQNYLESIKPSKTESVAVRQYSTRKEFDIEPILNDLDLMLDNFLIKKTPFNVNNEIKKRKIPKKCVSDINDWSESIIEDINREESDYGLTTQDKKRLIKMLTVDMNAVKITRKRKIDYEKVLSKFKYLKSYNGIESVSPVRIFESSFCVVFNTKYNILSLYKSKSKEGLYIKGSSIYNYDESFGRKRVRDISKHINILLNDNMESIIKDYDSLKTIKLKYSGQMNEHSIILRIL